jgi:hypothetical protein
MSTIGSIRLAVAAACLVWAAGLAPPASAQALQGTKVGVLTCRLSPSIGFIIGSHQQLACRFVPDGPFPPEAYVGAINTIGLDIGITAGGTMVWAVFAPTAGPMHGGLAGVYIGGSGDIAVGVGVGANVLFGGSGRTIALQPLSIEGEVGLNLALGASGLTLRWVP